MSDKNKTDERLDEGSSWVTLQYGGLYDWYDDSDDYTHDAFIGSSVHNHNDKFFSNDTAGNLATGTAATEREEGSNHSEQYDYDYDTGVGTYYKDTTTDIVINLIVGGYETWANITTEGVEYTKHVYWVDWSAFPLAQVTDIYNWFDDWTTVMAETFPDVDSFELDPFDIGDPFGLGDEGLMEGSLEEGV
ncbi:MAG: hypothetical protein H8E66_30395 [Planctomycetes bacterium]|nr:hypothetical protein [Planctomycetota bacterium]